VDFETRPVLVATSLMVDGRQMMTAAAMSMTDQHVHHAKMAGDKMAHKADKMADKMADKAHEKAHKAHDKMTMSAGKLARDGKTYYGQTVTVRAEVEDVLDRNSFTLDEDSVLAGPDVLVLVPAGFDTASLSHDQMVVVTGKVRPYVVAELDRDFDWFKDGKIVSTSKTVDYESRPVLVAETITTADGRVLMSQR
jgi:hypothetical protein